MEEIRTEPKGSGRNRNNKWRLGIILSILALPVAWITLTDRSKVGEMEPERTTAASLEQIIINRTTAFV